MSVLDLYEKLDFKEALARATQHPDEIEEESYKYVEFSGETVIHKAAAHGSNDHLDHFLKLRPELAQVSNCNGLLPIHLAAVCKSVECMQLLHNVFPEGVEHIIERGIHKGGTALHLLATYADHGLSDKHQKLMQSAAFLVDQNPNALLVQNDEAGFTPLVTATVQSAWTRKGEPRQSTRGADEFINYLRVKTASLPNGDEAIRFAGQISSICAKEGVTKEKIEYVQKRTGCSSDEAAVALSQENTELHHAISDLKRDQY
jgi:hypothetical protein